MTHASPCAMATTEAIFAAQAGGLPQLITWVEPSSRSARVVDPVFDGTDHAYLIFVGLGEAIENLLAGLKSITELPLPVSQPTCFA